MTELSPDAQTVLNAVLPVYDDEHLYVATMKKHAGMIAAAAIKAVADQVEPDDGVSAEVRQVLRRILAIATELEAQ